MVDEQEETQRSGSGGDGWCRSSKKPKLPKAPPQRGLGVAQLEKILRDQHQKMEEETENGVSLQDSYHFPAVAPPPPATVPFLMTPRNNLPLIDNSIDRDVPFIQNFDPFSPPFHSMTSFSGMNSCNSGSGGGGVAVTLPEFENYPILWNSRNLDFIGEIPKLDSVIPFPISFLDKFVPNWPSSAFLQSKNIQYPSSLMNVSLSSDHVEPPSNQRIDNYKSMKLEEEKMVGIKRSWPFGVDDQPSCYYLQKVPLKSPSSYEYHNGIYFGPNKAILRDAKKGGQSKQSTKKGPTDCGTLDASFLKLGPPATPLHSTQTFEEELSELHSLPFHDKDYQSQWSSEGGSSHQKPFYSFLPPYGQVGRVETSLNRRGDSVDLNLKLSVGSSNGNQILHFSNKAN